MRLFQLVGGTDFLIFGQAFGVYHLLQYGDKVFFVTHGRIGIVQIFLTQETEPGISRAVLFHTRHHAL